jgi:hypothetical protein
MASLERPRQRKIDTRFVTWNVWSLYRRGSLKTVAGELAVERPGGTRVI